MTGVGPKVKREQMADAFGLGQRSLVRCLVYLGWQPGGYRGAEEQGGLGDCHDGQLMPGTIERVSPVLGVCTCCTSALAARKPITSGRAVRRLREGELRCLPRHADDDAEEEGRVIPLGGSCSGLLGMGEGQASGPMIGVVSG